MLTTLRIMAVIQLIMGVTMLGIGLARRYPRWIIMGPIVAAMALTLWR